MKIQYPFTIFKKKRELPESDISYLQQSNNTHNECFLPKVRNEPGDSLSHFYANLIGDSKQCNEARR